MGDGSTWFRPRYCCGANQTDSLLFRYDEVSAQAQAFTADLAPKADAGL